MIYFDTSYLARLYLLEKGSDAVRLLASSDRVSSAAHGRAEVIAAIHRHYREGSLSADSYLLLVDRFAKDCSMQGFRWLPVTEAVIARTALVYRQLPPSVFLRAADAVHLACAAEAGFTSIHSNDTKMLAAAPHFGLTGVNVI